MILAWASPFNSGIAHLHMRIVKIQQVRQSARILLKRESQYPPYTC